MIEFLDAQSAFEHYKRVLGRNDPIETRAKYNRDCLHVEHYNAHTGQFIIGAVFTKSTRRNPVFCWPVIGAGGNVLITGGNRKKDAVEHQGYVGHFYLSVNTPAGASLL
jgi:hypothetical protein